MKILKRLSKVESAKISGRDIQFENLGGGISYNIFPFDTEDYHGISFYCYSSGSIEYRKKATKEEKENLIPALEGKLKREENPNFMIKKEAEDFFNKEIFKAAQEFDKKIEEIAKKYGYTRKK